MWHKIINFVGSKLGMVAAIFLIGLFAGIVIRIDWTRLMIAVIGEEAEQKKPTDAVVIDHIDLSNEAFHNLGIELGKVKRGPYTRHLRLPGEIIESPGKSNMMVAAPVSGIVKQIHTYPGQALKLGQALLTLQVVDEAMTQAQLDLLEVIAEIESKEAEIKKLEPLVANRQVLGSDLRALKYKRNQLDSRRKLKMQELMLRGLSKANVDQIVNKHTLIRELTVRLQQPTDRRELKPVALTDGTESTNEEYVYSIEKLKTYGGSMVQQGTPLIQISYHNDLMIKAHAFESDVQHVIDNSNLNLGVRVEYGGETDLQTIEGLSILFSDNHVEQPSRTFPFYVSLKNRVISESRNEQNALYRTWLFRPGQQVHVELAIEKFDDFIVVPDSAVAEDGLKSVVFVTNNSPEEKLLLFFPKEVRVVRRDLKNVLIQPGGQLRDGAWIAMNNAYKIQMAMKMLASSDDPHAGHNH